MDGVLLVDEMARGLDQLEHFLDVTAPAVEDLVATLLLGEVDDAGRPVDPGVYRLVDNERGQCRLCCRQRQVEQSRQAGQGDTRVVTGDRADILRRSE